jgi:hypothetical protein
MAAENLSKTFSRCGERQAGPGGILCAPCRDELEAALPEPARPRRDPAGQVPAS